MYSFSSTASSFSKWRLGKVPSTVLLLILLLLLPAHSKDSGQAILLQIDGAIGPAVSEYIQKGLNFAAQHDANVVVIQIDTPGGLDHAMRDIIQAILQSPVPVISYVYPEGARAASAGTYILYASHLAAMAPATNLGAATPVQIGGFPSSPSSGDKSEEDQEDEQASSQSTMERKIIHDAAAYIRSLADRNGRNGDWAEKAVRESVSLPANEALELRVINFVATDVNDLLQQANGHTVLLGTASHTLTTVNLTIDAIKPDWKNRILSTISDPNIAYLLLLFGMYGLIYELANPGVFFPGVAGAISILLALYGFQVLPVNYSGLALILLGIALLTSEAFIPSFGSLGIGGIIAFATGSFILFDEATIKISPFLIITCTAISSLFILWLMGRLLMYRNKGISTGSEAIIGMTGEVVNDFDDYGRVWLLGESWQAMSCTPLKKGDMVKITAVDGLLLTVEKFDKEV